MKVYVLMACDRHDEYPVAASFSRAALESHADGLEDDCMYGYKVVAVSMVGKPFELVAAALAGVLCWRRVK
jgi:hypothetical protein